MTTHPETETTGTLQPGQIEIDRSGRVPRVRFALPQEWFTLPQLRQFATYLTLVADENEPSPEVEELAGLLETCALTRHDHRDTARAVLAWMRDQEAALSDTIPERAQAED